MQIITDISLFDKTQWKLFVENHPEGNFFQSPNAYEFFTSVAYYKPLIIIAIENNEILGLLLAVIVKEGKSIKGFLSSRCIVWGGPLVISQNIEVYSKLLETLDLLVRKNVIYIEFRNFYNLAFSSEIFSKFQYKYSDHLNIILSLKECDIEGALLKMTYNRRREIKQSLKLEATVSEAESIDEIRSLYNILHSLYNKEVKLPLPSFSFFQRIYESKYGKVFIVKHKSNIIGGSFCFISSRTIYTLYYCGNKSYRKNIYPSHLAIYAPIKYATENRLINVDLMGAGKPNEKYGVREYKKQFGGDLVNYGRFIRINKKLLYSACKIGLKLYRSLKKV